MPDSISGGAVPWARGWRGPSRYPFHVPRGHPRDSSFLDARRWGFHSRRNLGISATGDQARLRFWIQGSQAARSVAPLPSPCRYDRAAERSRHSTAGTASARLSQGSFALSRPSTWIANETGPKGRNSPVGLPIHLPGRRADLPVQMIDDLNKSFPIPCVQNVCQPRLTIDLLPPSIILRAALTRQ